MVNSKNLTIVTISTILFGLLSKWLVGGILINYL